MTRRMYVAFFASLSLAALVPGTNGVLARPGAAVHAGFAQPHPAFRPPFAHGFRHHRRFNNAGAFFWPGYGDFSEPYGYGAPAEGVAPPMSNDVRYTYTYDVPWDWAHKFPPNVVPSDKPYVSSCPEEIVKVPGRGGGERTVSIMRCY